MSKELQIVVIGAGLGGLASALRLRHAGYRVTVLEAHDHPGGKMRAVPSAAGPVDTGPTVLTMRHVFDALFAEIDARLDDHVTLHPEPLLARHFWSDGSRLDLFADRDRSLAAVKDFAGAKAARQFGRFSAEAQTLFGTFDAPMMQAPVPSAARLTAHMAKRPSLIPALAPWATLARKLAARFDDPRLRQLFGRYATYVGGSPNAAPAVLSLIWHAEASGVWRVEGGMHQLAQAMADLAHDRGVAFQFSNSARRIETQSGKISAVVDATGRRHPCDAVVFNGDPRALVQGYLGRAATQSIAPQATEPRSLSAEVWAFAAEAKGPDLAHHNVFFGRDPDLEFEPIAQGRAPEDPTLYVCAQDRGSAIAPPVVERFEIICNAPPLPHAANEDFQSCHQRTFQTLASRGLTFQDAPGPEALTTPQAFDTLFPASQGSLYGRSPHGMMAAFARPTARTKLPGLYLAGGGAHPGAGVPMATLSGKHAAEAIKTDLSLTSTSQATDMRGGMSTVSRTMGATPSRSSAS